MSAMNGKNGYPVVVLWDWFQVGEKYFKQSQKNDIII